MRTGAWKGALAAVGALCLIVGPAPPARAAAACGDANNNGVVQGDPGDSILLLQFLGGVLTPAQTAALCGNMGPNACLDENADGAVNSADLVILQNVVAGNPVLFQCSAPPPPIACGTKLRNSICSVTLPAGCDTFIDGTVLVQRGCVVTVQAGATVKGKTTSFNSTPSVLVFLRGSFINGLGSTTAPILFTSDRAHGARLAGDWGGLIFNGRAPVNCPGGECLVEGLTSIAFGGSSPNDNSGLLTFARIEFTGIELSPDNHLTAFTMNGVGRSTTFNHLQANWGRDDAFEWFGGTVNMKYLVASACRDDCFNWQLGYTGSVQYALAIQNRNNSDIGGRHGFEGANNPNGFDFVPVSNPKFCNVTVVGTKGQGDTPGQVGRRGALLGAGTGGKIWNTVITDFTEAGVLMGAPFTATRACATATTLRPFSDNPNDPNLELRNVVLYNNGGGGPGIQQVVQGSGSFRCNAQQWLTALNASNNVVPALVSDIGPNPGITVAPYPTSPTTTQYIPAPGGPLNGSAATSCQSLDPSWMDAKTYIGAFQPGNTTPGDAGNWINTGIATQWVSFATN